MQADNSSLARLRTVSQGADSRVWCTSQKPVGVSGPGNDLFPNEGHFLEGIIVASVCDLGPLGKAIIIGGNPELCFPRRHVCHRLGNCTRFSGGLTPMLRIMT